MRFKEFITEDSRVYFHATNADLQKGAVYNYKGNGQGTFGSWEGLIHRLRPEGTISRKGAFFLSPRRADAQRFGGENIYKVAPVGPYSICALGWINILMDQLGHLVTGYGQRGYRLKRPRKAEIALARELIAKYYSGRAPTVYDCRRYNYEPDAETKVIEVLANKIVIK